MDPDGNPVGNHNPGYDHNMNDIFRALVDVTSALQRQNEQPHQPIVDQTERQAKAFKKFMDQHPPKFAGSSNPEEAEQWISEIQNTLEVSGIPIEFHVLFGTYLLKSEAGRWWSSIKRRQNTDEITWAKFEELFNSHYIRQAYRVAKMQEFMELKQGDLSVAEYAHQFSSLSRYCPEIVANEQMRAMKFQDGLKYGIRSRVVPFQFGTYDEVVEAALLLEHEFSRAPRQGPPDRRNSSKGKGPQSSRRNQGRFGEGGSGGKQWKDRIRNSSTSGSGSGSGSSGGSSGRSTPYSRSRMSQGSSRDSRQCYTCHEYGHIQNQCPRLNSYQGSQDVQSYQPQYQPFQQQPSYMNPQPLRTVEHQRPQIQYPQREQYQQFTPPTEQRPRGQQQPNRGGNRRANQDQGRAYAMVQPYEGTSNAVIEGNFLIYSSWARILFDSGANNSFISASFVRVLGLKPESLGYTLNVDSPFGMRGTDKICRSCIVYICGHALRADLIVLKMSGYDVILGMDWLSPIHGLIDCFQKKLTLQLEDGLQLQVRNESLSAISSDLLDSFSRLPKSEGYLSFLSSLRGEEVFVDHASYIPVVGEFPDVFPEELPVQILDSREQVLRNKTIPLVRVLWRHHGVEESTWELASAMAEKYPFLFD